MAGQAVPRFRVPVSQHDLLPQLSLKELYFIFEPREDNRTEKRQGIAFPIRYTHVLKSSDSRAVLCSKPCVHHSPDCSLCARKDAMFLSMLISEGYERLLML